MDPGSIFGSPLFCVQIVMYGRWLVTQDATMTDVGRHSDWRWTPQWMTMDATMADVGRMTLDATMTDIGRMTLDATMTDIGRHTGWR